jgi:hypothetical protein
MELDGPGQSAHPTKHPVHSEQSAMLKSRLLIALSQILLAIILLNQVSVDIFSATCTGALQRLQELQVLQALRQGRRQVWCLQIISSESGGGCEKS